MIWIKRRKCDLPTQHVGVLVRTVTGGMITFDVACYTGNDIAGEERWIMADIRLEPSTITHWAYIEGPRK